MLFYRSSLPLSRQTLNYTTGVVRRHRTSIGSRGWALTPGTPASMVLVYLRKSETFVGLGAGFGVSTPRPRGGDQIAPERLLVLDVSQGWQPLCQFLHVPVPDDPFPRVNDAATFAAAMRRR